MAVWGDHFHPSHQPDVARDLGFSTGVVYCRSCGTLLRSSQGMGTNARVTAPCTPVPALRLDAQSGPPSVAARDSALVAAAG